MYYKIYIDSKNQANITPSNTNTFQFGNTSSNQKKPRQPISFKDENAMNAAIKKQENALLLVEHRANQKKKTLAKLNLKYGQIKKDSLLQSSMKQEIKSRLMGNLDKRKYAHDKQEKKIIDELKNQKIEIYKINAVQYHTTKQKLAAVNLYNSIQRKKPSVKREIKSEEDYNNTIKKLLEKYNPRQQNYQDKSTSPLVNHIDSNINITTKNDYKYIPDCNLFNQNEDTMD